MIFTAIFIIYDLFFACLGSLFLSILIIYINIDKSIIYLYLHCLALGFEQFDIVIIMQYR